MKEERWRAVVHCSNGSSPLCPLGQQSWAALEPRRSSWSLTSQDDILNVWSPTTAKWKSGLWLVGNLDQWFSPMGSTNQVLTPNAFREAPKSILFCIYLVAHLRKTGSLDQVAPVLHIVHPLNHEPSWLRDW